MVSAGLGPDSGLKRARPGQFLLVFGRDWVVDASAVQPDGVGHNEVSGGKARSGSVRIVGGSVTPRPGIAA